MTTWEEIRDEIAGMLADGQPLEDVIGNLEKRKNEMAKANLLKAMDEMKKREQTKAELDKKWENTVWDTDVYLDDIDGKVPLINEEWFCQLPTEEKAKVLETITIKYLLLKQPKCYEITKREFWEMWLKQPHRKGVIV